MTLKYWLIKSEPEVFSIDDLANSKNKTTYWNGVRNYQARNFMRDEMKVGDKAVFYHSNSEPPGAAGICEVVREAYTDFTAFDPDSPYFDPKAKENAPAWVMVDVKFLAKFEKFVPLSRLREEKRLQKIQLLQRGNRLSVMPLSKDEYDLIVKLGL